MTNVIDLPTAPGAVVVDENYFEKFGDAALLLMCFERAADAVEVVEEGGGIHLRDDVHTNLMEACMALAVLFRRRTGHTAQQVSADHLEEQRRCLLSGEQPRLLIPVRPSPVKPLPATAFIALSDLRLAQVAFNYATRVSDKIKDNSPQLVELDLAQTHSLDAMNALSTLISRLSSRAGAELQDKLVSEVMINAPSPETLQ